MIQTAEPRWDDKQNDETRGVEKLLKDAGFTRVDAYRYNSASIRVRVIDPRFENLSLEDRDAMVEPFLDQLPERTQADIMNLYAFAPSELELTAKTFREYYLNREFDDPSLSMF